ncbi:MAG TPA: CoA transferase [Steroidobacteraceae bacterium]|nr:CoA transferase [Steroidobacteraceae bacterium]
MKMLDGTRVLAFRDAHASPLARFLRDLGADVQRCDAPLPAQELAAADLLVENLGLARIAETGLSRAQIEAANPRLVHVSVSTFGSSGPRRDWRGSELVASAMGGILRLCGDVDRPPVKEALNACEFHADMVAAVGALAALAERRRSGLGQHVDVSTQEVAFSRNVNGVLVWQFDRRLLERAGGALNYGRARVRCIWALADGYCFHSLMTGRFGAPANQGLSDWMDACGADNPLRGVDWNTYNRSTLDPATRERWEAAIAAFFRTRTRAEINDEGRRRGINATVIATPADVLADPHLEARGFWRDTPAGREPGRFLRVQRGSQPSLPPGERPTDGTRGPLSGVRILDFSWALVGSITTKTLGDLGAEVVKLESRTRPCLSRLDVQVAASRAGNLDDKPWFSHLNTSKFSLSLDLKAARARELLEPLIDWADVVVENFSPGTLEKLGLDYAHLAARNPGLIMVSGSVYGQTGPLARSWGVDGTGAALSGRTYLTGWPDRDPVIPSAAPYGDVILPFAMAAAVIAALEHRHAHQRGCHIDASMYELCVQQMRDALLPGAPTARSGNADAGVFLQGVYATSAPERWIAVTFHTQSQWQAFAQAEGLPDADPTARDAALAAWCAARTEIAAVEHLQDRKIAAGVVQDVSDLVERDPQIRARGSLLPMLHPLLGEFGHMRTPIDFSRSRGAPFRAPGMGEHNRRVALEICGLSQARFAELESQGVFK